MKGILRPKLRLGISKKKGLGSLDKCKLKSSVFKNVEIYDGFQRH